MKWGLLEKEVCLGVVFIGYLCFCCASSAVLKFRFCVVWMKALPVLI